MNLAKKDIDDLRYAKTILENPSLAARISNLLGTPIEKGFEYLPTKLINTIFIDHFQNMARGTQRLFLIVFFFMAELLNCISA